MNQIENKHKEYVPTTEELENVDKIMDKFTAFFEPIIIHPVIDKLKKELD